MPTFVGNPPADTAEPDPSPPDPDDPDNLFISPSGNDSTGDGSIGNPWATLAKFIAEAADGNRVYCRDGSFGDLEATVDVANVTIAAYAGETPTFDVARATIGLEIAAAGVTIDGLELVGPGADIFGNAFGIYSDGTYDGLTVVNSTLTDFDHTGVFVLSSSGGTDVTIDDNTIARCTYAGVIVCAVGGSVQRNDVRDIGADAEGSGSPNWNAYGIAVTMDPGGTPSSDVLVQDNYIDNVPPWHGLDTHGGVRVELIHNEVHRCARPIFITAAADDRTEDPQDCEISYNLFHHPATSPNGTDAGSGITLYWLTGGEVHHNVVNIDYPTIVNDVGAHSTASVHDNVRGETLPDLP